MRVCFIVLVCLTSSCVDLTRPPELTQLVPPVDGGGSPDRPVKPDVPAVMGDADATVNDGDVDLVDDGGSPDGGEVATLVEGSPCDQPEQCASGFCAQGVCCLAACGGICQSCNLPGQAGQCLAVPAGEDPGEQCAGEAAASCKLDGTCDGQGACRYYPAGAECAAGTCSGMTEYAASTCDGSGNCLAGMMRTCASGNCMGGTCAAPCTLSTECQSGFFCDAGRCALKRALATACSKTEQCASGFCVDGVCCMSECGEHCFACNVAGTVGSCKPVPGGTDPRNQCAAEVTASCGRDGMCNGSGGCRLHPVNTACGSPTCSGTTETPARSCDGLGVCRPPAAPRDCAPYACGVAACAVSCADSSACAPGWSCQANVCARVPGLALFWRFEEANGFTAFDSSGNGRVGTYLGDFGTPVASIDIPILMYPNARSRAFNRNARHAVQTTSPATKLVNDFTVSAWYRATRTDSDGSEIVSAWNGYILRVRNNEAGFFKRLGNANFVACEETVAGLDGRWHHVAGVASRATGMKLYFDGIEICSNNQRDDVTYNPPATGFFVGRHGDSQEVWDFDGNIDEVRLYTRPLSAIEITPLAQGRNN